MDEAASDESELRQRKAMTVGSHEGDGDASSTKLPIKPNLRVTSDESDADAIVDGERLVVHQCRLESLLVSMQNVHRPK